MKIMSQKRNVPQMAGRMLQSCWLECSGSARNVVVDFNVLYKWVCATRTSELSDQPS